MTCYNMITYKCSCRERIKAGTIDQNRNPILSAKFTYYLTLRLKAFKLILNWLIVDEFMTSSGKLFHGFTILSEEMLSYDF